MDCLFACKLQKFGWWLETRPGKHSHHGRSHWQSERLSEKWLPCHIANVGSKGGWHRWNSVDNCSWQIVLLESGHALGSDETHWPAKAIEYGDHTSTSVSLSWSVSRQGVTHRRFQHPRSTICWIPWAQRNHYPWCVLWNSPKSMQVHQEQKTGAAHRGCGFAPW